MFVTKYNTVPETSSQKEIFGFSIDDLTLEQASQKITRRARSGLKTRVAFVNAHCINVTFANRSYKNSVTSSDMIFADGSGLRYAARLKGIHFQDNVNGTDLFPVLCQDAALQNLSIYLLGGKPGIAKAAADNMQHRFPDLKIAGTHHGYMRRSSDEQRVIDQINQSGADIVLVGFGVPRQELWIEQNAFRIKAPVLMGVGGLFDYYSGNIPRAPQFMRNAGLEWIWRLYQEPRRLWKRYILGNIEFMARSLYLRFFNSRYRL